MLQKPEADNKFNFLRIRLCFINVFTYPYPKTTPYKNAKIVIVVVQCEKLRYIDVVASSLDRKLTK